MRWVETYRERNEITEILRLYARREELLQQYIDLINPKGVRVQVVTDMPRGSNNSDPTLAECISMETAKQKWEQLWKDMHAVEIAIDVIKTLEAGVEIMKAVEQVYWKKPLTGRLPKGVIVRRVRRAAINIGAVERTVYRWLRIARREVARQRGLRE